LCAHQQAAIVSAITIRNLPDTVHAALKRRAALEKLSVEALVRRLLAAAMLAPRHDEGTAPMTEFAEIAQPWVHAPSASHPAADLWGALRGTVHIPAGTDLAAALDEDWEAAR
jgi:plasmid stability protein